MQIQLLDCAGAQQLYETRMVQDFPAAELKPFTAIREMMQAGIYEPLALCGADGALQAYAFQVLLPGERAALLDLILECEHPEEAPDKAVAERRIAFYLRAGACATRLESRVFGVRYNILSLPCGGHADDAVIGRQLKDLYRMMVPEPYYRGNVIFYGP